MGPPLSWLLTAATPITRIGMALRNSKPVTKVDAHVISIGNLTAGGTGKTPAVIRYAREAVDAGKKVGILTRGYGTGDPSQLVVSEKIPPEHHAAELGDEPAVILRHVPEALVFKSKDRTRSAQIAETTYDCDVLILDDGYQYVQLHRDENVLVIDACNPFGNGHLLPRGYLREPIRELKRATKIIVTRCDQSERLDEIRDTIAEHHPDCPVEWTVHAPTGFWSVATGESFPVQHFEGQTVHAACGIGSPEAFRKTLEGLGVTVAELHAVRDHAQIPAEYLKHAPTIVTEKDAVRLQDAPGQVYALGIELREYKG